MSAYPFARFRSAITLMALVAIFAALLPAQSAAGQSIPPVIITFTEREFNEKIYQLWVMTKAYTSANTTAAGVEHTLVSELLADQLLTNAGLYYADVILKEADALQERYYQRLGQRGADSTYREGLPPTVVAEAIFAAALETPFFRDSAKAVYQEIRGRGSNERYNAGRSESDRAIYRTFTDGNVLADASRTLLDEKLDQAAERAKNSETFAKAFDAVFAPITGIKFEDVISGKFDAKAFLASHPEAGVPQEMQDAIKPDGSLEISLADLERLAKGEFAKINASIDDMQKTLATLSEQQGELVDFMNDQKKRQKAQAIAEAKAKEHQLKLAAASSAVSIVSTLVGLKYPERGKQIAVIGQSAIKIGESINGWMQAVSGLSTLSKLGSLSTVVMTSNVLGAVMNVVSLFGPEQPPPEQLILEEIGKLRQEVNELRTEMHTRFDQIDKQLNAIYTAMNDRFNLIDIQLGKITGKLDEIQLSLLNLGVALDRMERNNVEYLDAIGRRPLREAINGGLGYKERTGADMPYQPDFVNYENIFHTWGTVNAFDALSAGPSERNYSDGQVLAELSAAPLDANLNYLNGWLSAHGMQPFATKRLPSPRDWAFASRAYAGLGMDWPAHLKRIGAARQAALDAAGKDLEQALANISTIQTADGPQGNAPLWSGLTSYYTSKMQALDAALLNHEMAFVNEVQTGLNRPVGFDLYGGLDQSLTYQPTDFATMTCGGGYAEPIRVAAPHNLKNMVPAYNRYALADYLGLNTTAVCWYPELVDRFEHCQGAVCEAYGFVTVQIVVKSPMGAVAQRTFRGYPAKWGSDVRQLVVSTWATIYRPKIEAELAGATPAAADTAPLTSKLATRLNELQRALAVRVQGELTRGQLGGIAVELAGAKKLLESFVTLGFPQAVGNDDFLRSLILSNEAIIDNQQVAVAYTPPPALGATAAISEAQLLVNPRIGLHEAGTKRSAALSGLLFDYLGSISTQNYREDNALVAGTRFDMAMARAVADPSAPPPGQSRVIFLPLVGR